MKEHDKSGKGTCWCKDAVPVLFRGKKVGTATISHAGIIEATVDSDMARKMRDGSIKNVSIATESQLEPLPRSIF